MGSKIAFQAIQIAAQRYFDELFCLWPSPPSSYRVKGNVMKPSNIKNTTQLDQRIIEFAMDYSERMRSYGNQTDLVKVEDYLDRLPTQAHQRFLELVNLDALAGAIKGGRALGTHSQAELGVAPSIIEHRTQ
jgi:hypothetical protein